MHQPFERSDTGIVLEARTQPTSDVRIDGAQNFFQNQRDDYPDNQQSQSLQRLVGYHAVKNLKNRKRQRQRQNIGQHSGEAQPRQQSAQIGRTEQLAQNATKLFPCQPTTNIPFK